MLTLDFLRTAFPLSNFFDRVLDHWGIRGNSDFDQDLVKHQCWHVQGEFRMREFPCDKVRGGPHWHKPQFIGANLYL